MLEERVYTQEELSEILGTIEVKNIKAKLKRYNVDFTATKVEESYVFDIHRINDKFKVFCILELKFPAQTNFSKLKYFVYYFFNDNDFNLLSHKLMMKKLKEVFGEAPSRETIDKWVKKLRGQNLFIEDICEYRYFSVDKESYKEISHEEYKKAWNVYWKYVNLHFDDEDYNHYEAIIKMYSVIGGKAVKRPLININGFYNDKIKKLTEYALESIEQEINSD
ncbi:MAG: hypothetical protein IJF18_07535 [Oscillospiraceae bacterium]|nr:hypothetical protein [Oscillospiraceae bacterium]